MSASFLSHALAQTFFQRVDTLLTEARPLYLLGGVALRYLGSARATLDLDYVGADPPSYGDPLVSALVGAAAEMGIEIEAVPLDEFIPLPAGVSERHLLVERFEKLTVYVFDPYSIALSKCDRGFESDIEDVAFLINSNIIEWETLCRLADQMVKQASRYLIDPERVRAHLREVHKLVSP